MAKLHKKFIGKNPPDFCLPNQDEKEICLSDYRGSWILVYLYPKDMTSGCTTQACTIRDAWDDFKEHGIIVLGISADSAKRHKKFRDKHSFPFDLLSDEDKNVVKKFNSYVEKSMFGRTYMGIARNSFLISPDYEIVKVYEKVKPAQHAHEVFSDVAELKKTSDTYS